MGVKIVETEYYLPEKQITSKELLKEFSDFDVDKIENKIGVKTRHVAGEEETSLDLAFKAASILLEGKNYNIDFIIYCTQTPEYILPTNSCILQERLDLPTSIGALDFNLGCSGFIYGLSICKGLIETGVASTILFITTDTYSKYIHKKDKGNRSIFGDGATATILSYDEDDKIGEFILKTDGKGYDKLIIKNGATKNPFNKNAELKSYGDGNFYNDNCIYMNGPDIFNFTIKNIPKLINEILEKNDLDKEEIDYFIFHQANKFMLEYLRKKIDIPVDKFHNNLTDTGNTVSSTIPIAMKQALKSGKIKKGDKVLIAGFGVGLSWGATLITI